MSVIQEKLNSGTSVTIPYGEYEGPFLVDRSARIDGGGALFYTRQSDTAALNISTDGVRLLNLSVQADSPHHPALFLCEDTKLSDVRVFGEVVGKKAEEGFFDIPYALNLGDIPPDSPFEFTVTIDIPTAAVLEVSGGVTVSSETLSAGRNTVGISLPPARAGSLIRRVIVLKTAVNREMIFTAAVTEKAAALSYAPLLFEPNSSVYTAELRQAKAKAQAQVKSQAQGNAVTATPIGDKLPSKNSKHAPGNLPYGKSGLTAILPKPDKSGNIVLSRGMHCHIAPNAVFEVDFFPDGAADVDAYVFLHDGTGRLEDSRQLVFFGNDSSADGSIRYLNTAGRRAVFADFLKIQSKHTQIDFVYAVYGGGDVLSGTIRIKTAAETMIIPVSGDAATSVAFEIARKSQGLVLTPLIMPYRRGIAELIRNYGLEVN